MKHKSGFGLVARLALAGFTLMAGQRAFALINLTDMMWGPNALVLNSNGNYLAKYNAAPNYGPGYAYVNAVDSILMIPPTSPYDSIRLQFRPTNVALSRYVLSAIYALPSYGSPADVDVSVVVSSTSGSTIIDHFVLHAGDNFARTTYLGNWPTQSQFSLTIQLRTKGINNWYQSVYFYQAKLLAAGGYVPSPPNLSVDLDTTQLPLSKPSSLPYMVNENPPALASSQTPGAWTTIYNSTSYAYVCSTGLNPLLGPVQLNPLYCSDATLPGNEWSPGVQLPPSSVNPSAPWMRNYDGVFSAHVIWNSYSQNYWVLTVNHNETKNEWRDGQLYQNPFSPTPATQCASGYGTYSGGAWQPGPTYYDCMKAYDAFVSTEWNYYTAGNNYGLSPSHADGGPVIWPTDGYYDANGNKTSTGAREPSSIIHGDYIYIFYQDGSFGTQRGLSAYGIKVARGLVSQGGGPGSFTVWNGTDWSTPALPAGFDKNSIARFMAIKGPQVPSLFATEAAQGDTLAVSRFAVGYDAARQMFVGVDEYVDQSSIMHTRLRLSVDLVHWSAPTYINVSGTNVSWEKDQLHYPEFANAQFNSNTTIDLANLYILGSGNNGGVNQVRLHVN